MNFHWPPHLGDTVAFHAQPCKVGEGSMVPHRIEAIVTQVDRVGRFGVRVTLESAYGYRTGIEKQAPKKRRA